MPIEIRASVPPDIAELARLRWQWSSEGSPPLEGVVEDFVRDFTRWWSQQRDLVAIVAADGDTIVAMGFLAIGRRVADPRDLDRRHGDIQSVYVRPEYRGRGIGSLLVRSLVEHGREDGCIRITVHSGTRAVPVYERAGFEHSEQLLLHPLHP